MKIYAIENDEKRGDVTDDLLSLSRMVHSCHYRTDVLLMSRVHDTRPVVPYHKMYYSLNS